MTSQYGKLRLAGVGLILAVLTLAVVLAPEAGAKPKGGKGGAKASTYLPPKGKSFAGTSDTGQTSDYREYRDQTKAHPAVMQSFESWGYVPKEAIKRWQETRTRGMLSLSTSTCWRCDAVISNQSIAEGKGDRYIVALAKALAQRKKPTYIRLFPEMNGHWNAYSAFHGGGKPRPEAFSTANFKRAWKRFTLIVRGGKRAEIEKRLKKLGMPKLQAKTKKKLVRPKVALAWVPQAFGSPNVKGNQPGDYFPGYEYVDWVGGDIYGKFPSLSGLDSLYKKYSKAPFMIGEWSPWDVDQPKFVASLFDWFKKRGRARMIVNYQGFGEGPDNEYELGDYPQSLKTLRRQLNQKKLLPFAPETEKPKKGKGGKGKGGKKGGKGQKK